MKKVIFGLAVVAVAAFGAYNANKADAKAQMSDLQLENIEALGQDGEPDWASYCDYSDNDVCRIDNYKGHLTFVQDWKNK